MNRGHKTKNLALPARTSRGQLPVNFPNNRSVLSLCPEVKTVLSSNFFDYSGLPNELANVMVPDKDLWPGELKETIQESQDGQLKCMYLEGGYAENVLFWHAHERYFYDKKVRLFDCTVNERVMAVFIACLTKKVFVSKCLAGNDNMIFAKFDPATLQSKQWALLASLMQELTRAKMIHKIHDFSR